MTFAGLAPSLAGAVPLAHVPTEKSGTVRDTETDQPVGELPWGVEIN
tara:strand:+ start:91557 stop:91697 length:141 start_codon:yes stop_codon:yes gene_type:complete